MAASGAAAAAAAAIANAIKASGAIVSLEPTEFLEIVRREKSPLIVRAEGGFFSTTYKYLTSYKGLMFYTESSSELMLPADTELVRADKIWMPG